MNKEPDWDNPEDFERFMLTELRDMTSDLKRKHSRRARSPLIFVQTFLEAEKRLPRFEGSGWDTVERELVEAKQFVESLRSDYLRWIDPAKRQAQRNELWDQIYNAPPPFLEGGRADGNS